MKSLVYNNPLISAIIINTTTLIISIYLIINNSIYFLPLLTFVGIANRNIIDNGQGITKNKKIIILISFFLMIIAFLAFGSYMHDLRDMEITNGTLRY
ncbi:hypothetical protein [Clostridium manihotivorum]|uniref:Uncharacterized protein n=1 Tax=Clostridium manihotivorum TaxID=2320868 RepID=A0A3R5QSA5_9CLOT|nr:hypothetical protein [Clostridium manihotivorum]QAA31345.1 hypothetical protein C1I91_06640 [Clostridium manihotivorum]